MTTTRPIIEHIHSTQWNWKLAEWARDGWCVVNVHRWSYGSVEVWLRR